MQSSLTRVQCGDMFYSLNKCTAVDYRDGKGQSEFCLVGWGAQAGQCFISQDPVQWGSERHRRGDVEGHSSRRSHGMSSLRRAWNAAQGIQEPSAVDLIL